MKKGNLAKGLLGLALGAAMILGGAAAQAGGGTITITGSTTVLPVAQKAAEVYMKKNPGVRISVAGTGSGDGIKAVIDGTADIGDSSRDMKAKEIKMAKEKGVTPKKYTVAMDCIVPVVNPANPVKDLSLEQLKGIYTGKVKNWKDVGGNDKPVVVISRDSSSGTFEVWNHKVLGKKTRVRPDAQLQASNGAVAQAVAGNKYAIGYVGIGYLNPKLKGLTVDGVTASPKTAIEKTYPIARGLYMFTNSEPKGEVAGFITFVMGPEGQKIVKEEGFVPIN
ncbi:MAG: phosphate ABC transporter substrate-binding protein [Desulfarculus sp.]|nr:phosphate ABC transporter substrate-binding protein [Pseudomonadota bacterium]MBV1716264.1 phosphate ABC transporter substrate-binding protein [Desulfarculus sp.]MBU4574499.1 phosphate ABC transporter substrate-binding protein [Pseudomonadota bacterium]MBU4599390.1 phosphate ABC transporter substrate-binding protein [Pseudomonadota bacterium]MBV1737314.1 phosphate ABC transporter substrate-binding protein [Desulfarculus sp.]